MAARAADAIADAAPAIRKPMAAAQSGSSTAPTATTTMTTLPLLRQRSREASLHGNATPSGSRRSEALAQCASARSAKDIEGCLLAARAALKQEASCGKAWAFLCWSLFELRRYEEARAECLRALSHRAWPTRDREGMAALLTSCRLLSELTPAMGERLRDGWYQKRLRALYDAGGLYEYELCEQDVWGFQRRKGVGRNELSLLDDVPTGGMRDVRCGGDGGERNIPAGLLVGGDPSNVRHPHAACFGGPNFPVEQALGGVVYLNSAILSFHCDKRFGPERDVQAPRRLECYDGNGPCRSCMRNGLPVPTHRFPEWTALAPGATIVQPHAGMDVFYSTDAVAPRLHQQLSSQLDALARKGGTRPMPKYHNVIDPNLNAVDGLWVPSEFDVVEKTTAPIELAIAVELACLAATGHRLPFGFGHDIAKLASLAEGVRHADCAMRSTIPDLEPHAHAKLHVATQKLMGAALPMLAKLRRPALLLPGPLQAVVKAQRIVLAEGEDYAGVWHEDGMDEHVVGSRSSSTTIARRQRSRAAASSSARSKPRRCGAGMPAARTATWTTPRSSPRRCRAARCPCVRGRSCASPTTPPCTACCAWRPQTATARVTLWPSSSSTSATRCPRRVHCRRSPSAPRRARRSSCSSSSRAARSASTTATSTRRATDPSPMLGGCETRVAPESRTRTLTRRHSSIG